MAKQIANEKIIYLTFFLLTFLLSGCSASNVYHYRVLPQAYQVLEFNSPKSLRLVIADYVVRGPEHAVDVAEAAVLTARVHWWGESIQVLIENASASHLLKGGNIWASLGRVTEAMTYDAPDRFRSGDPTEPTFWIISINPPVIAEGRKREDFNTGGRYYDGEALVSSRLARKQDLTETATAVYILDRFPSDPGPLTGSEANAWEKSITGSTRRVQLPTPMTVGEIMKHPSLWAKE